MEPYGQYGSPSPDEAPSGTTTTVKVAVGFTILAIALAVVEAIIALYMHQNLDDPRVASQPDDIETFRIIFAFLIGLNLLICAGLAVGSVLTVRRNVAGKVLIWLSGAASALMRCNCGGLAGLFVYIYTATGEERLPVGHC